MPVSLALNLVSFIAQTGVLHLMEFLLYSPTCIVKGVFLVAGLWIIQEELPEYFDAWNQLGKNVASLLEEHKLRDEVDQSHTMNTGSK
ncbi:hypothetical protein LSAT2_023836 [Lamellibrachia satsuma]|nr:hypothetical protein LSAT2_023836 [Lamellibrachia satsuma]